MKPIELVFLPNKKWYCDKQAEKYLLMCADIIAMTAAFIATTIIWAMHVHTEIDLGIYKIHQEQGLIRIPIYLTLLALTVASFWIKGHYSKRRLFTNEVREIVQNVLMLGLLEAALIFFWEIEIPRESVILNCLLAPCFLLLIRYILKYVLINTGGWVRPMVIVGWGENARQTAAVFAEESMMGFGLGAFLIPNGKSKLEHNYKDKNGHLIPSIFLGSEPSKTLKQLGNPHIVLALEQGGLEFYQEMVQQLSRSCLNIHIVPSLRGLPLNGMVLNHFFAQEVLVLSVRNNLARLWPQLLKRCFDLTASICVIVISSPLLLWVAVKVLATGRPIFYGHIRVGQNGNSFACYKFRTMQPNADKLLKELLEKSPEARAEWECDFKLKNDPRITKIGHFLRKTSIDELPQLWNVLKGEMSLVGPRPVVKAELKRYGNQVDYYLEAKPGITGLWQVSGRNNITYDTRVYLDAWYVKNWSLFHDFMIICKTIKVILTRHGAY